MSRLPIIFCALMALLAPSAASAQTLTVTGVGSTIVINFNAGYTLDRANTVEDAAQIWADALDSSVDIEIDLEFRNLACTSGGGTLGSAGTLSLDRNFPGAPETDTLYSQALANALAGSDRNTGSSDLTMNFNAGLDDPAQEATCLTGFDWHYGTTAAPAGTISFYEVVLHEIAHGLGFQSFADWGGSGALFFGDDDQMTHFLEDQSAGVTLTAAGATNAQRATAATDDGDLVWTGPEVTAEAVGFLTAGTKSGDVLMYAPSTFRGGSSIAHFDTTLTPDEVMEPSYTGGADLELTKAFFFDIGWEPANARPEITGQVPLDVDEDDSITLALTDFTVDDPDSAYPADFTLEVRSGANYTFAGAVVTPDPDFDGTLTVPVVVNDGNSDSAPFDVTITVNPINDPPEVTGQLTVELSEDETRTITEGDLVIDDPDDTSFTVTITAISGPTPASFLGATLEPDPDAFGSLTATIIVNDGDADSAPFDIAVEVLPVNDPPVITGQRMLSVLEDSPLTLTTASVTFTDVDDSSGFGIRILPGSNYSASGAVLTPALNYNGTLTVGVVVDDGADDSAPFDVSVEVLPVDDPPEITGQVSLSTNEDTPIVLTPANFTIVDPDDTAFTLTLMSVSGPSAISGTEVTPGLDYNGPLTVSVVASASGADSLPFSATIAVISVNDPPVVSAAGVLSMDEDTSLTIEPSDLTITDPDDTAFTVEVLPGADYTSTGPTLTPARDFNGTLTAQVQVSDGEAASDPFAVVITVNPVNDPPQIVAQRPLNVDEDNALTLSPAEFTIDDVEDDPVTLILSGGVDYVVSGLTITPAPDFNGELTVPVQANDGADDSDVFSATVTVVPVPDAPVITGQSLATTEEDVAFTLTADLLTIEDVDGDDDFSIRILPGDDYTVDGSATVVPAQDLFGTLSVAVVASDGAEESAAFPFQLEVTPVNDPPVIVDQRVIFTFIDTPVTIGVEDLVVRDPDDETFTLALSEPSAGMLDGATWSPDPGFAGVATLQAVVDDGALQSEPFALSIAVGDPGIEPTITVDATGLFTPRPALEAPTALGVIEDVATVTAQTIPELLRPGTTEVIYTERNAAGEEASFVQELRVRPLFSLAPLPIVREGGRAELVAWLNGPTPERRTETFVVRGASFPDDHTLADGDFAFTPDGPLVQRIAFEALVDDLAEGEESLTVNTVASEAVGAITDAPLNPRVSVDVRQDGRPTLVVSRDEGPVVLLAEAEGQVVDWTFPPGVVATSSGAARVLDPSSLPEQMEVAVQASTPGAGTSRRTVILRTVDAFAPPPLGTDSDGDGVLDEDEPRGDADQNGIEDAYDPWPLPNVLPFVEGVIGPDVVEATAGVSAVLGPVARRSGARAAGVEPGAVRVQDEWQPMGLYVDVIATELARPRQAVSFVHPTRVPLPAGAGVRVLAGAAWFDFVTAGSDAVASAPDVRGACPPPESVAYVTGLTVDHTCVRVTVSDGGPNDADGAANREISALYGLALAPVAAPPGDGEGAPAAPIAGECTCRDAELQRGHALSMALGFGLFCLVLARRRLGRDRLVPVPSRARKRRY